MTRLSTNETSAPGKSVQVSDVVKRYGNHHAVDKVSFDLKAGELLTLLGPSGSGKTTMLMMVAGFETPDTGTINVDGRNVVGLTAEERSFGVVFQGYALFPHMTARENVEFPLKMRNVPRDKRRKLALEMLDRVGLGAMTDRRPRAMSGGQQQRVALARALVFKPDALLLDEPLGALDKNMREKMQYEIKELQRTLGISILFVTHDQEEAMTMSDRIAVMNEGRIVQVGSPKSVYTHPNTAFVAGFLGETNMLPCKISDFGDDRAGVIFSDGRRSAGIISREGPTLRSNDAALLSVRPEKVTLLHPKEEADFMLMGVVKEHTFIGRHCRSVVEAAGREFAVVTADTARSDGVCVGSQVSLGWSSADAQILLDPGR
ncbi:ABC transporter ATP-binding protein [Rhizobium lusitanum]|uniref:ABC transporter ATP-binding protein n=1 Tax=Rhizobium lusitanum TaxID=293958 RepID=UPI001571F76B|nr:ABC transporter ATP-binding protein [Rhizobium lusitanum]NTJ11590.1 ABC transporter ATP-binding protein [Rhizobium lusitanum]